MSAVNTAAEAALKNLFFSAIHMYSTLKILQFSLDFKKIKRNIHKIGVV